MSDKRDQARNRWMQMFENLYPKYESLFSYGKELVVADAETLKTYGEDGKEYTLQMAPWEVEDQLACKLNNPDYSLLTEKSEVADAYIAGVAWGYNRGVKDCERGASTIESLPPVEDMGEVSDGYHTFNQLYHQRAVLFATIVNQNKDKAWKSWKHEDGEFCFDKGGEWFIVGVDTPEGSYTYHYEKKYWDTFDCEELDRGKHWDGHTDDDVTRLLSLPSKTHTKRTETHGVCSDCISRQAVFYILVNKMIDRPLASDRWVIRDIGKAIESLPPVEPEPVCSDCISKHDLWRIIEDNAYWVTYNETSKEKGMTLTGINQALNECPPVEPTVTKEWLLDTLEEIAMLREERPRGEWINTAPSDRSDNIICDQCGYNSIARYDYCPNCGSRMFREDGEA